MAIDISRESAGEELLPPVLSQEIWANTLENSAVMRLGRQVPMPASGKTIPMITGDAVADWVGETDEKPVSRATLGYTSMTPYKMAVIEPFSDEFRRDLPAVYRELARRLPNSLAVKLDSTVFGNTPPGSNFDTLGDVPAVRIGPGAEVTNGTYAGLIEAEVKIADAEGTLDGWALSPAGRALLLAQVDSTGRPLIANDIQRDGAVQSLLGVPVIRTRRSLDPDDANIVGMAGDWTSAMWGTVEGIKISISDVASITDGVVEIQNGDSTIQIPNTLNLWQRNMFAIRVEAEFGFKVRNKDHFVRLDKQARESANP